ncbi:MAG: xanthine dehydrogenase family protein subunit M [Bradyrhizobium sp.]|nr:xanthine dehydrogenase family protein subunit M [Bradyrhizobium sp.]
MKPASFDYFPAPDVDSAVRALASANGDAKLLAGGQSLVPMLNFRLLRPSLLVDINGIPDLSYVREDGDAIRIGATTRHRELKDSSVVAAELPVLREAMHHVAHLAIRNRGTIGGSLSHADPAAELPMMSLLLDASFEIASSKGRRTIRAAEFFVGALTSALEEDDMLVEVHVPKLPVGTGWSFQEIARRSGDFAMACVAVVLTRRDNATRDVRIALTGIAQTPLRAKGAESILEGKPLTDEGVGAAVAAIRAAVEPNTDLHASADYRRHAIGILADRAIRQAWERTGDARSV